MKGTTSMSGAPPDTPTWIRSPWVTWSWLLVLGVVVAQSLNYHWRALPTSASGYYTRGRADYMRGEYEDATRNLTKSIELDPTDAESYIWRGEAYAKLQEFEKALPDLEKALELAPDYPKSHAARADYDAIVWDADGAIREYSRALEKDPLYARCYLERGKLLYDAGRWDDAAADLRRGTDVLLDDNQVTAQLLLWLARARAGGAAGATVELADVVKSRRIHGNRFWNSAKFLCGELAEPAYFAAMADTAVDNDDEVKAEAFFLAAAKRLAFGDRAGGLALMRNVLKTESDTSYAYDRARRELERLLLGFHPMRIDEARRKQLALPSGAGLAIVSVIPGGAAEATGIRPGSIVAAIDGVDADQGTLIAFLVKAEPGSTVELQIIDGAGSRAKVTLSLTPDSSAPTR